METEGRGFPAHSSPGMGRMSSNFQGLGFRGLGFRGLGFRGLGFRGLGFRLVLWKKWRRDLFLLLRFGDLRFKH